MQATTVSIPVGDATLDGDLTTDPTARGIVVFAHGSGSSRHSPRNRYVSGALQAAGLATLLFDLLTADEEEIDVRTRQLRFDIGLLAGRLTGTIDWLAGQEAVDTLPTGLFGASTGAAAALVTAAQRPDRIRAVVSRGGRPDLAGDALRDVHAPTLLIVGGNDPQVLALNEQARDAMAADTRIEVIPGASHLFEEPGTLDAVADLAARFFLTHLR